MYNFCMDSSGRSAYTDEQYRRWLYDLAPYLFLGNSLDIAIKKAGLQKHRTTLYEKARLNDWFSDKIEAFQSFLGDLVNETFSRLILRIYRKVKNEEKLTSQEGSLLRFFAVTHRSTIPYFVHRNEKLHVYVDVQGNVEKVLDNLDKEVYNQLNEPKNQIDPSLSLEDPLKALLDTL